jgi:hypothetical protein
MHEIADDPQNRLHKGSVLQKQSVSKWVQPFPQARMRLARIPDHTRTRSRCEQPITHERKALSHQIGPREFFNYANGLGSERIRHCAFDGRE